MAATLTKTDLANARSGVYECRECLKEIERIEACGLDCQQQKDRANHLIRYFEGVLQNYTPLVSTPTS